MARLQGPGKGTGFIVVLAEPLHLSGGGFDDVEELVARWNYTVAGGALWRAGADQPKTKGQGHIAALVHCKCYIAVSLVTLDHDRLQFGGLFTCIRQHSCLPLVADGCGGGVLT
ncbi:hypothetical protein A2T76_17740 [Pseudomonas brenneri]|nr:hypothetical protein A2T76_17740 [Pseudomonas brenneri]